MKKNILTVLLLVLIDQLIKYIVLSTIGRTGNIIEVLNILTINYIENTGAAFGIFNNNLILIGLDIMIIVVILKLLLSKKYEVTNLARTGYSLILAGGIGNLIDRIFRGHVIDYIDISKIIAYPVFNIADMCIVIGVIIVIAVILINTIKSQENVNERV